MALYVIYKTLHHVTVSNGVNLVTPGHPYVNVLIDLVPG